MQRIIARALATILLVTIPVAGASANEAAAGASLASIFTDNAVLQRGSKAAVWGKGNPGDTIRVELGDLAASTKVGADGKWLLTLPTGAAQEGQELRLISNGALAEKRSNVAVGEVYLCSGQSNMEWSVEKAVRATPELRQASDPNTRLLKVISRHSVDPSEALRPDEKWRPVSEDSARKFSAICYYFGKHLREKFGPDMPIGLIANARGGAKARAFMSYDKLAELGGYEPVIALNHLYSKDAKAAEAQFAAEPIDLFNVKDAPWVDMFGTSVHYNAMLAPILPYTVKATAWYQGESDAAHPKEYRRLLPALIENWREDLHNPDMPFFIIQLAGFGAQNEAPKDSGFVDVREVQAQVVWDDPNTALVHTIDLGDPFDVHPTNKQEVARRLFLAAERLIYKTRDWGCDIRAISAATSADGLIVNLPEKCAIEHVYEAAEPLGFQACDADGACRFASAQLLDPRRVRVQAPAAKEVAEIRYCWTAAPFCNSYMAEGEPLPPFTAKVK